MTIREKFLIFRKIFTPANIKEITDAYADRNTVVVPLFEKLQEIEQEKKTLDDISHKEAEEQHAINLINKEDEKLPTLDTTCYKQGNSRTRPNRNPEWDHNKSTERAKDHKKECKSGTEKHH